MSFVKPIRSIRYGIRSLPADLLVWSQSTASATSSQKPSLICVFICGNPGLVDYYTTFLSILHSTLPNNTTIHALGHLGHSKENKNRDLKSIATLKEQVQNQIELLDELNTTYGIEGSNETKLVTISHSVGSWISLEILKQRPNLITSLNFLFPTISNMALTPNGQKLSYLFSSPSLLTPLSYLTSSLNYLPTKLVKPIVKLITSQKNDALEATHSFISSSSTVSATITMGGEEMRIIKLLEYQHEVLKLQGGKIRWYWASETRDGWVLESSIEEIEEYLNKVGEESWEKRRVRCEEGMDHAFILNDGHVDTLARKVAGWILEDVERVE